MSTVVFHRALLLAMLALLGCSSDDGLDGGDASSADCASRTVDEYCPGDAGCSTLPRALANREAHCASGGPRFARGLVTGCGFAELRGIGPAEPDSWWFEQESGDLVGATWLSDFEPECNGTFVGIRAEDCEDVTVAECSVCGWDRCEFERCQDELETCLGLLPGVAGCALLWECAEETGCEGASCLEGETCSSLVRSSTDPTQLARFEALVTCATASGCTTPCSRSIRDL
jgi:hypothetical protein